MNEPTPAERDAAKARVDRALRLVFTANRTRLAADDPMLVLVTLLQDFLVQADSGQRDALREFQVQLDRVRAEWEEASRHRAETVVNAALQAAREAIDADLQGAATQLAHASAAKLNDTIAKELLPLRRAVSDARRLGTVNIVAAIITMLAATIALAALLHFRH